MFDEETFNHIAYAYRSWPMEDQAGVVARYEELVKYVESCIEYAVDSYAEAEACGPR